MNGGNVRKRRSSLPHQAILDRFYKNTKRLKTNLQRPHARTLESNTSHPIRAQIPLSQITEVKTTINAVTSEIDMILKNVQSSFDSNSLRRYRHKKLDNITCKLENKIMSLQKEIEAVPTITELPSEDIKELKSELEALKEFNNSKLTSKEALLERIRTLMSQSEQSKQYCKSIHQLLQSVRGNIRTCCRIKPSHISRSTIGLDSLLGNSEFIQIPTVINGYSHSIPLLTVSGANYIFDNVFGPEQEQVQVFEEVWRYLERAIQEKSNALVLAVGEKGSGKHYTINGPLYNFGYLNELTGVLPRTLCKLLEAKIGQLKCKGFNVTTNGVEMLFGGDKWVPIDNIKVAHQIAKEYAMESERCKVKHSIFQITIKKENGEELCIAFAILEDLRVKENEFITRSYKALADVLKVLVDIKLRSKLIPPYKNSTLTKSLASVLTSESCIVFLSHVTNQDGAGTQATLKFLKNSLLLI